MSYITNLQTNCGMPDEKTVRIGQRNLSLPTLKINKTEFQLISAVWRHGVCVTYIVLHVYLQDEVGCKSARIGPRTYHYQRQINQNKVSTNQCILATRYVLLTLRCILISRTKQLYNYNRTSHTGKFV